ncbi:MAG: hypothetical protein KF770_07865 [Anaerolineae bacterium]|nr:hypothetical protein [Anaerolineae bacterium]
MPVGNLPTASTAPTLAPTLHSTSLPVTTTPTSTMQPSPTATSTESKLPTLPSTPTEGISLPTSIVSSTSNLIQVSSMPDVIAITWESEETLRLSLDSSWDSETRCTTNFRQGFNISYVDRNIEALPLSVSEVVSCPEPKPVLSDASISALPGAIVGQEVSPDKTHSLLFVEVMTSTLPMIQNVKDVYGQSTLATLELDDLPILEGWVISHETETLYPVFATQLGYVYTFLPGYNHLIVQADCYGTYLGSGLHIIDLENKSLLTLAEDYSGMCEGAVFLAASPNGQYFIHSKGTIVSVNGELKGQLCTEEQFPRSWAWSSDSQQVFADCYDGEHDFIWQYDIDTGTKVLLNDLIDPTVSPKARDIAVSPDMKWLAFIWGASELFSQDEYGVWVIKLEKDNE